MDHSAKTSDHDPATLYTTMCDVVVDSSGEELLCISRTNALGPPSLIDILSGNGGLSDSTSSDWWHGTTTQHALSRSVTTLPAILSALCPEHSIENHVVGCDEMAAGDNVDDSADQHDDAGPSTNGSVNLEALDRLRIQEVRDEIVPFMLTEYLTQDLAVRLMIANLIGPILNKLGSYDVITKSDLIAVIQALAQDIDSSVRCAVVKQMPYIARTLSLSEWKISTLPHFIELCRDDDPTCRQLAIAVMAEIAGSLEEKSNFYRLMVPLFRSLSDNAYQRRSTDLLSISRHIGPIMHSFKSNLNFDQKSWFVRFYCSLCSTMETKDTDQLKNDKSSPLIIQDMLIKPVKFVALDTTDELKLQCRKWCAFNFPAIADCVSGTALQRQYLEPLLLDFAQDSRIDVRRPIAAALHALCPMLNCPGSLRVVLDHLLQSADVDVLASLVPNFDAILTALYNSEETEDLDQKIVSSLADRISASLDTLHESSAWRAQEQLLLQVGSVGVKLTALQTIRSTLIGILLDYVTKARAIPCRRAAGRSILLFLRHTKKQISRQKIFERFVRDVAQNTSCYKRQIFLELLPTSLEVFSRSFVKQHFLLPTLKLAKDPVSNIRLRVVHALPLLRSLLDLPADQAKLDQLDATIRHLLMNEGDAVTRDALQAVLPRLEAVDIISQADDKDAIKEREEAEFFSLENRERKTARVRPCKNSLARSGSQESIASQTSIIEDVAKVKANGQNKSSGLPRSTAKRPARKLTRPPSPRPAQRKQLNINTSSPNRLAPMNPPRDILTPPSKLVSPSSSGDFLYQQQQSKEPRYVNVQLPDATPSRPTELPIKQPAKTHRTKSDENLNRIMRTRDVSQLPERSQTSMSTRPPHGKPPSGVPMTTASRLRAPTAKTKSDENLNRITPRNSCIRPPAVRPKVSVTSTTSAVSKPTVTVRPAKPAANPTLLPTAVTGIRAAAAQLRAKSTYVRRSSAPTPGPPPSSKAQKPSGLVPPNRLDFNRNRVSTAQTARS